MKKLMLATALFISGLLFQQAEAQIKVNLNVNLGQQPVWGPTGYDHADFYYLPDIDSYYDVTKSQFVYNSGNRWVYSSQLPAKYKGFDLYNGYKVVVNEPKPYMHADVYGNKYRNNKAPHEKQTAIRDSREEKYYQVKGHPMHNQWVKNHPSGQSGNEPSRGQNGNQPNRGQNGNGRRHS